jgi:hypothetical protein
MSNRNGIVVGNDSSVGPNDVLLGRGNRLHKCGNEKFRNLVRSRSLEYWSCNDNVVKDNIARQIIDAVISQQGRFLRKVKHCSEGTNSSESAATPAGDSGVPAPVREQWEVADTETVLIKIKQTFRDFTASNKKRISASLYNTSPLSLSDVSPNLQNMSILERLQNLDTLASPPLGTFPDSNHKSRLFPSADAHEMLFQNARASQLNHLVNNAQQQLHQQNSQDKQLMALFEQQRAILMTQLQQSSLQSCQTTLIDQPSPNQQRHTSNLYHSLATQSAQPSLNQQTKRLPSTVLQLPHAQFDQQMHLPQHSPFQQTINHQTPYQFLIDQQIQQAISSPDGSVSYPPPQFTSGNQNVSQTNTLPFMNQNTTIPTLPNWSMQPLISTSGMQPPIQNLLGAITQSHHLAETRFNEHFNQQISYPSVNNMSSNVSINEMLAMSDNRVHVPVTMPYPNLQVSPVVTTDTIHPSASRLHEDDNNKGDDVKKPPAH